MKKRRPRKRLTGNTAPTIKTARTGEHCPMNGCWIASGEVTEKRLIAEGSIMPTNRGQSATWILVDSEDRLSEPKDVLSSPEPLLTTARYNIPNPFSEQRHTVGTPLDVMEQVPLRKTEQPAKKPPVFPASCEEDCFYCEAPETD